LDEIEISGGGIVGFVQIKMMKIDSFKKHFVLPYCVEYIHKKFQNMGIISTVMSNLIWQEI